MGNAVKSQIKGEFMIKEDYTAVSLAEWFY